MTRSSSLHSHTDESKASSKHQHVFAAIGIRQGERGQSTRETTGLQDRNDISLEIGRRDIIFAS